MPPTGLLRLSCYGAGALLLVMLSTACVRPAPRSQNTGVPVAAGDTTPSPVPIEEDSTLSIAGQLGTAVPVYAGQPTADAPHYEVDANTSEAGSHIVAVGETLGILAQRYDTTVEQLMSLNGLTDPDIIHVGQSLQVPGTGIQLAVGPDFKIVPDSELVYSPGAAGFDTRSFLTGLGGYINRHSESVEGQMMDGPAILQLVADRHSVNPRLLIAVLEHQTGWISQSSPPSTVANLGTSAAGTEGLYRQLSFAANLLNLGYYGRAEGGLRGFNLGDSVQITFSPVIDHGTAAVQRYFAGMDGITPDAFERETGAGGLYATYNRLFGNPFAYTFEPIVPDGLTTPPMELPWAAGETWFYTGGPHGAWNSGSAWGALDFVPPADAPGCIQTDAWVTSMTDGVVVRSGNGAVVVDVDGDGFAGTGWAITYMHLETRDRAALGTAVKTGDRLGHPSCEGGFSNGTHLHIARSYNGQWISADGALPFEMSGWVSSGAGAEYDGYLTRAGVIKTACVCREEINSISP